ncbi:hypothetical protein FHG87_014083 [Trinorchestia longiramus]|nr:hypothetical protein FHG87_014083 [Trinorchestia longiramus]
MKNYIKIASHAPAFALPRTRSTTARRTIAFVSPDKAALAVQVRDPSETRHISAYFTILEDKEKLTNTRGRAPSTVLHGISTSEDLQVCSSLLCSSDQTSVEGHSGRIRQRELLCAHFKRRVRTAGASIMHNLDLTVTWLPTSVDLTVAWLPTSVCLTVAWLPTSLDLTVTWLPTSVDLTVAWLPTSVDLTVAWLPTSVDLTVAWLPTPVDLTVAWLPTSCPSMLPAYLHQYA